MSDPMPDMPDMDEIDHINNVLNRTPGPSAATIRVNERLNRGEPPTGIIPPTREEPPVGIVPSTGRDSTRINPLDMYYEEETPSAPRPRPRVNTGANALADRRQLSRLDAQLTSMEERDNRLQADRTQNSRGQPAPQLRTPNLERRRIPLASSPLDYLEQPPPPNLGRPIQTQSRRAPPIPQQAIQVNPQKEQLCIQLFGRSNNGCLDLTMEQLETIQWAMDNGQYQRTGNETYQTILPIAEDLRIYRTVIGCLLELANKYRIDERSRSKFATAFYAIHSLKTSSEPPQTIYQRMLDTRQSISDEAFEAIPWTDTGFQTRASLIVKSINPPTGFDFLANFAPEIYLLQPYQFASDTGLRKKMLEIYDCLISIMLQLYPQLGNRGGKLKRKRNKKSYKKRKGKRRKTKRKY